MNLAVQYELFEAIPTVTDLLRKEVQTVVSQQEKYRKSIFAKHAELLKLIVKQQEVTDRLKCILIKQQEEIQRLKKGKGDDTHIGT